MKKVEAGRLAFREEGELWNAYYAPKQDSMKDALLLLSIRMNFVKGNPELKLLFMEFAKTIYRTHVYIVTGVKIEFGGATKAPEYERSGHG